MKRVLSFLLPALLLNSCKSDDVSPLSIEQFTGYGFEREWNIKELYVNGINFMNEGCFQDDTILFSKGYEADSTYYSPAYVWKKNGLRCSSIDKDIVFPIEFHKDGKSFSLSNVLFNVETVSDTLLIISSEVSAQRYILTYQPKSSGPVLGNKQNP